MGAEAGAHLLLTTDTVGGVWHYTLELARGLTRRGLQVTLAAMGGLPSDAQCAQAAAIDGVTLHARAYRLEWMDDCQADLDAAGNWLQALAAQRRVDLVHLNQFAFGACAFDAPNLVVGHSSVTSWWRAVRGQAAPPAWDAYRAVVRRGLCGADQIAAPTQAMLQSLRRDFDWSDQRGVVLPNGRDPADFAAGPTREPLIIAVGRLWDEAKNLAVLDRAAAQVDWPVVVVGPTRAPLGAADCAPARHARLIGELSSSALAGWLGRASICAHPAHYEPFGLSVLEAALSSCALVLSDIDSLREVWQSAALYVRPDDDAALARALQRLIDDAPLRVRMAARARTRAMQFSADAMCERYLDSYRSLLLRQPRQSCGAATCTS